MDHANDNQHPNPTLGEAEDQANQDPRPSAKHPRSSALKRGRGGRREGAGAPKGNLNGLRHGRRSRQMADLAAYLARNPKISAIIANQARHQGLQEERTEKLASRLLANILIQGIRVGKEEEAQFYRTIADMME